jgi:segregation and condensation protein A
MAYDVRTPVFEGPFDLLLHLIMRREVELFEVSLTSIIDEYLAELERMESLRLDVATEFLLIAATLVELKTRRLLPEVTALDLDEELSRYEERDLLLARLLECKTFKDVGSAFASLMRLAAWRVPRSAGPEEPFRSLVPDPLERVRPERLAALARRALEAKPQPFVDTDHVAPIRATVADAITVVLDRLPEHSPMSFRVLVADAPTKVDAIVRFLAILELFKQGIVDIEQAEVFGDLSVRRGAAAVELDAASVADWDLDVEAAPERVS